MIEISSTSLLARYAHRYIAKNEEIEESRLRCVSRRTLKGIGILFSIIGNVPFIEVNLKSGGGNLPWGVTLAFANGASYAMLVSWALSKMIDDYLKPISIEESQFQGDKQLKGWRKGAVLTSAIVLGIISPFPIAYFGYISNNISWMPQIFMGIAPEISDSWVAAYSSKLTVEAAIFKRTRTEIEKKIFYLQEAIIKLIQDNRDMLTQSDITGISSYINSISSIEDPSRENIIKILSIVSNDQRATVPKRDKLWNWVITGTGTVMASTSMFVLGYLSKLGAEDLTGNAPLGFLAFGVTVSSNFWFQGGTVIKATKKVCNIVRNIFSKIFTKSLTEHLHPKLSFVVKGLSLGITLLSFGPAIGVSTLFDSNKFAELYFAIVLSISNCLLVSTAALDIVDQILAKSIQQCGRKEIKMIFLIDQKLLTFKKLLQKSPILEIAKFSQDLPEELFNHLTYRISLTRIEIQNYIQDHFQSDRLALTSIDLTA